MECGQKLESGRQRKRERKRKRESACVCGDGFGKCVISFSRMKRWLFLGYNTENELLSLFNCAALCLRVTNPLLRVESFPAQFFFSFYVARWLRCCLT